jgi:hypothetical protein
MFSSAGILVLFFIVGFSRFFIHDKKILLFFALYSPTILHCTHTIVSYRLRERWEMIHRLWFLIRQFSAFLVEHVDGGYPFHPKAHRIRLYQ